MDGRQGEMSIGQLDGRENKQGFWTKADGIAGLGRRHRKIRNENWMMGSLVIKKK